MKELSEDWKKITLKEYLDYRDYILKTKEDEKYKNEPFHIYEYLEKKSMKAVSQYELNIIIDRWDFLKEDFEDVNNVNATIDINNDTYLIQKDFNNLSFLQWQNMEEFSKTDILRNIHIIMAIASSKKEDYDYDKAIELSELLNDSPMYYIIPNINFFFYTRSILTRQYSYFFKKRRNLSDPTNAEYNQRMEKFNENWGWYECLVQMANEDITKFNYILALPLSEILTYLTNRSQYAEIQKFNKNNKK